MRSFQLLLLLGCALAVAVAQDAGQPPYECSNTFPGIGLNSWRAGHIECHPRDCDAHGQLKCDVDTHIIRQDKVNCNYDPGYTSAAIDFSCPLPKGGQTLLDTCDWKDLQKRLSGCVYTFVRTKAFQAWHPS